MRQVWIPRVGPPEVLEVREAADPPNKPGHVKIRVAFSGINFADTLARIGQYPDAPKLPCVMGYEVSGTVEEIASDVTGLAVGQRVVALTRFGGYSDVVVTPAHLVIPLPDSLSFEKAASIPVNYLTAWVMLIRMGSLAAGETVLVHAAAGGVGQAALQICNWKGAEVIGTASPGKHARLKELGVKYCIDYTRVNVRDEVKMLTNGRGVDYVMDSLGGKDTKEGYKMLAPFGRLCTFGASSFAPGATRQIISLLTGVVQMPFFHPLSLMNNNRVVMGVNLGHLWDEQQKVRADFEAVMKLVGDGTFDPVVDKAFAFKEAAAAHQYIHDRKNFGKVLLKPE
jgi:NADPH:quinone reductase-like Zn-dependent oxidoreductase